MKGRAGTRRFRLARACVVWTSSGSKEGSTQLSYEHAQIPSRRERVGGWLLSAVKCKKCSHTFVIVPYNSNCLSLSLNRVFFIVTTLAWLLWVRASMVILGFHHAHWNQGAHFNDSTSVEDSNCSFQAYWCFPPQCTSLWLTMEWSKMNEYVFYGKSISTSPSF